MVVHLEMTTKDVTLFSSMFYIRLSIPSEVHLSFAYQYPLFEQFHHMFPSLTMYALSSECFSDTFVIVSHVL